MPVEYPHYNEETGELEPHEYLDAVEVGALLHLHPNTVRTRIRDGQWEALHVARNYYMDARMIGDAVETMHVRVGMADTAPVVQLGTPVSDTDVEPIQ